MEMKEGRFGRVLGILISMLCLAAVSASVLYFYPAIMEEARELGYFQRWWSSSDIWDSYYYSYRWGIPSDYYLVAWCAVAVVSVIAFLLPFIRGLGLKRGLKANIPLELLCVVVPFLISFLVEPMPELVLDSMYYIEESEVALRWNGMLKEFMTKERETMLIYVVNGFVWFVTLGVAYVCVLSARQLFSKGLVRYLKENTIIGILICCIIRRCAKFIRSIQNIDFKEKGTQFIWKAVLLNFIAIMIMCCIWFFGILAAVIYSFLLLFAGVSIWKKIKKQYDVLLLTTRQMAEGTTDVKYVCDVGIFNGLQEELKKVQTGFEAAVKEEVKSQRMKTELITNVSHDLKTPLTAIITYVDLLKKEDLSEEERQSYIQVLEQKSARLKTLIEDLFEVSKATSGNIIIEAEPLDLTALVKEVQVEMEDQIMQSGIEFRIAAPEEKVLVSLDGKKTCRIFENLFGNILKYGMPGSRAYITIERDEDIARVILKNVSAKELAFDTEEITERFVRGDAARTTEGSGLGLAIAKSFAEAQGGCLYIRVDGDLFKAIVEFQVLGKEEQSEAEHSEAETSSEPEAAMEETLQVVAVKEILQEPASVPETVVEEAVPEQTEAETADPKINETEEMETE